MVEGQAFLHVPESRGRAGGYTQSGGEDIEK